jgi:hypothetical protein
VLSHAEARSTAAMLHAVMPGSQLRRLNRSALLLVGFLFIESIVAPVTPGAIPGSCEQFIFF